MESPKQHGGNGAQHRGRLRGHTLQCHKCPANRIVQNLATQSPENVARARAACMACAGWNDAHHVTPRNGVDLVYTGALADESAFLESEMLETYREERCGNYGIPDFDDEPAPENKYPEVDACRDLLTLFRTLTETDVLICHGLMNGLTMQAIGAKLGISKQAVFKRVHNMIAHYPILDALRNPNNPKKQPAPRP